MSTMVTCAKCFEDRSDEDLLDSNGDVVPCRGCGSKSIATSDLDLDPMTPNGSAEPEPTPMASADERVCAYGPCAKSVLRPDTHIGWYSKFCSRDHASAAKAERGDTPTPRPAGRQPAPRPEHPARSTAPSRTPPDADLRRRYFDLLMDRAAAAEQPSDDLLDRIERLLEILQ